MADFETEHYMRNTNLSHYEKAYLAFVKKHLDTRPLFNFGEERFQSYVVKKLPDVEELVMLGVGSGTGENDIFVMSQMLNKYSSVRGTFVDPSPYYMSKFKELYHERERDLQAAICDWRVETLEEYRHQCEEDQMRFHFIDAFFCFYYIKNPSEMLLYLYQKLAKGGILMVSLLEDPNSLMPLESEHFTKISTAIKWPSDQMWKAQQVLDALQKAGIPYEYISVDRTVDVGTCFDDASEEGSLILDLFVQKTNFRNKASSEDLQKVLGTLRSITRQDEHGLHVCTANAGVVIVQKE